MPFSRVTILVATLLLEAACSTHPKRPAGDPKWLAPLLGSLPVRMVTPGQDLHPIDGPLVFVARGDYWILDRGEKTRWHNEPLEGSEIISSGERLGDFSRSIRTLLSERYGEPIEPRPRKVFLTVPDQQDTGRYRLMETIVRDNGFEPVPTLRDRFGSLWGVPIYSAPVDGTPSERRDDLSLGGPEEPGLLRKDDIRSVMISNTANFKRCADETPDSIGIKGRLTVRFIIESSGRVSSVSVVDDTVGHAEVFACMAEAIRGARFLAPRGGGQVIVTYPFLFR